MYLNKSVPERLAGSAQRQSTSPDYAELVRFLLQPFLDSPESLRVDCEISNANSRVWIRLAFFEADKGRVFGRGGRNIQAIRTVIQASAMAAGQSVYLDIYGSHASAPERDSASDNRPSAGKAPPRRAAAPRIADRSPREERSN